MKRGEYWILVLGVVVTLAFTNSARAVLIEFVPDSQSATLGSTADFELVISGLGDFSPDSLSTFDIDVSFDPAILSLSSVIFGDPILGDRLDLFGLGSITDVIDFGGGTVNLFELSFDFPDGLDTLQAGSFTLATLTFDTLALGTSDLLLFVNALGDSFGLPIFADVAAGSIEVVPNPVPEPDALALFIVGLLGLGIVTWRRQPRRL